MEKNFVLFGAGKIGKEALQYFSSENILCFADNDVNKIGGEYCGKAVISVDELKKRKDIVKIIITNYMNKFDIAMQLNENGFTNYTFFDVFRINERLSCYGLDEDEINSIALYSTKELSLRFLDAILQSKINKKVKFICSDLNSLQIGKSVQQYTIATVQDAVRHVDVIIIINSENHIAEWSLLKKRYGNNIKIVNPFKQNVIFNKRELIVNKYIESNAVLTEAEFIKENERKNKWKMANAYVERVAHDVPFFEMIELETFNRCNGSCSFCSANKNIDIRKPIFMSEILYKKTIGELSLMKFDGFLALSLNNEPLLDKRIINFARYAKENVPRAHLNIHTNGTLFTMEIFKELVKYFDEIIIDNYSDDLTLHKPCIEIVEYTKIHPEIKEKVTISLRKQNEILNNRGGVSTPNRSKSTAIPDAKCTVVYQKMSVRSDGKVSLCCNDVYGDYTLGDLNCQTVSEVWFGNEYNKVRNALLHGRESMEACKTCDVYGLAIN